MDRETAGASRNEYFQLNCVAAVPQGVMAQPEPGGSFSVVAMVVQGQICVLEARTNLTVGGWVTVTTNTALTTGPLTLTDGSAGTHQTRFYRLRYH